jgi:glycerate kinase
MQMAWCVQSWAGGLEPKAAASDVADVAQRTAPHVSSVVHAVGDGGPRTADVWGGAPRERVGGADIVRRDGASWLLPAHGATRWDPVGLSTALIGLAADPERRGRVVVPVGDTAPAGDAASMWGPSIKAFRHALKPLDMLALVTADRPLLGFHGMSAALLEGREGDSALASAAQAQEERWAGLALEADAVAAVSSLVGPARPSDVRGTGAAGGLAYALHVGGARLVPAFRALVAEPDVARTLSQADVAIVVTPELTPRTLDHGLATAVSAAAAARGIPTVVLCETLHVGKRDLMAAGVDSAHTAGTGVEGLREGVRRVLQTWARR